MLEKLKERWKVESNFQIVIIFIVFACTGFSVLFIKPLVFDILGVTDEMPFWLRTIIWLATILPLYNLLLIIYGTLFGQREFFWWFLKKMTARFIPGSKEEFN